MYTQSKFIGVLQQQNLNYIFYVLMATDIFAKANLCFPTAIGVGHPVNIYYDNKISDNVGFPTFVATWIPTKSISATEHPYEPDNVN